MRADLYVKSRTAPHWSTWPTPPSIPLEDSYEVDAKDEFEPYVDTQQDKLNSNEVEVELWKEGHWFVEGGFGVLGLGFRGKFGGCVVFFEKQG